MGMVDYINREAVRNELYDADAITMKGVAILNNFPSANVVEVVWCKDCDFRVFDDVCKEYYCNCVYGLNGAIEDNSFCSYGERRTNDSSNL